MTQVLNGPEYVVSVNWMNKTLFAQVEWPSPLKRQWLVNGALWGGGVYYCGYRLALTPYYLIIQSTSINESIIRIYAWIFHGYVTMMSSIFTGFYTKLSDRTTPFLERRFWELYYTSLPRTLFFIVASPNIITTLVALPIIEPPFYMVGQLLRTGAGLPGNTM